MYAKQVEPSPSYFLITAYQLTQVQFEFVVRDYLMHGTPFLGMYSGSDYNAFIRMCKMHEAGKNLLPDNAPYTRYFLSDQNGVIYAQGDIRHYPTKTLTNYAGYIGYGVLPSFRGRGYGKLMCALLCREAKKYGYTRVLVTCNIENQASARIIECNGGVFEDIRYWKANNCYMKRYWIDLT